MRHHYIALVPMGGKYKGRIAQHSVERSSEEAAREWATNRFSRPAVIVDMTDMKGLTIEEGVRIYHQKKCATH